MKSQDKKTLGKIIGWGGMATLAYYVIKQIQERQKEINNSNANALLLQSRIEAEQKLLKGSM